jgi:hypothetical protein
METAVFVPTGVLFFHTRAWNGNTRYAMSMRDDVMQLA